MSSFGPTFYADCEIIINAFEKGAAYSSDPRSVYAMATPVLSKMRSDAKNVDNQFGKQFSYQSALKEEVDTQNAGTDSETNAAAKGKEEDEVSTPTPPEVDQEKRWVDKVYGSKGKKNKAQTRMSDCIPCEASIRSAERFHNNFWAGGGFENQYLDIVSNSLEAAAQKLKNIMNMFRDQGMKDLQNICDVLDSFSFRCPSDIAIVIKGLSTLLVKFSIDLAGDINFITGLISSLIGPLISGIIQLLKNYIQIILEPIKCIINALLFQIKSIPDTFEASQGLIQELATGGLGVQTSSGGRAFVETEYKNIEASTVNPITGENISFGKVTVPGGNFKKPARTYESPIVRAPIYSGDVRYERYLELENLKEELETSIESRTISSSTEPYKPNENDLARKKKLEEIQNELDGIYARKFQKGFNDAISTVDKFHTDTRDMIFTTIDYLSELTKWIEDYCKKWLKEFGRLVGDSFAIDIGFLEKLERKLTLLQMIGLFSSYFEFLQAGKDKCNEDDLQKILTRAYGYGNKAIIKTEGGGLKLVDENTGDVMITSPGIKSLKSWKGLSIQPTEDPDFDAIISSVGEVFTSPSEAIFSCNRNISSKENTEQLQEWMEELQE